VQLSLPLSGVTTPAADAILFVRHRRARRYILRVLADGTLRVTLPRWGVKRDAWAFVAANRDWICRQRAERRSRCPAPARWADGTAILIDGVRTVMTVEQTTRDHTVTINGETVACGLLALEDVRAAVEGWLRARAARELPPQLQALAATHGIVVPRISIRDQRSRWGSCSPSGTITLNWRLVQTPPFVREYVLIHELMHRKQMNHSRRFWRLVAAHCPRFAEARRWLIGEGKSLWPDPWHPP
jgi:predicted metal-dependent hydrolase